MKKTLLILFAIVTGFTSCDKVNDLKTKEFYDIELSKETVITVNTAEAVSIKADEAYAFSETINLNLSDIDDIKDYLNKLEDVDVTSVNCEITGLSGGEIQTLIISVPDLNFEFEFTEVSENQSLFVNFTAVQLDAIADALLKNKTLKITISGTVSEQPSSFTIETLALVDVEVEVV
ncbi:hypothetical protein [Labilibaculum sp.]|uniref:hypothetical protein n=1 Tax=Labilibaculum sp. TaxID=2060723 RepID=UPI003562C3A7